MHWCQWHRGQPANCLCLGHCYAAVRGACCSMWEPPLGTEGPLSSPHFYPLTPSVDRIRQCVKALSHTSLIWSSPPYPSEGTEQVLLSIPALARWGHRLSETEFIQSHELCARPCIKPCGTKILKIYVLLPVSPHTCHPGEHFFWYVEKIPQS